MSPLLMLTGVGPNDEVATSLTLVAGFAAPYPKDHKEGSDPVIVLRAMQDYRVTLDADVLLGSFEPGIRALAAWLDCTVAWSCVTTNLGETGTPRMADDSPSHHFLCPPRARTPVAIGTTSDGTERFRLRMVRGSGEWLALFVDGAAAQDFESRAADLWPLALRRSVGDSLLTILGNTPEFPEFFVPDRWTIPPNPAT